MNLGWPMFNNVRFVIFLSFFNSYFLGIVNFFKWSIFFVSGNSFETIYVFKAGQVSFLLNINYRTLKKWATNHLYICIHCFIRHVILHSGILSTQLWNEYLLSIKQRILLVPSIKCCQKKCNLHANIEIGKIRKIWWRRVFLMVCGK